MNSTGKAQNYLASWGRRRKGGGRKKRMYRIISAVTGTMIYLFEYWADLSPKAQDWSICNLDALCSTLYHFISPVVDHMSKFWIYIFENLNLHYSFRLLNIGILTTQQHTTQAIPNLIFLSRENPKGNWENVNKVALIAEHADPISGNPWNMWIYYRLVLYALQLYVLYAPYAVQGLWQNSLVQTYPKYFPRL